MAPSSASLVCVRGSQGLSGSEEAAPGSWRLCCCPLPPPTRSSGRTGVASLCVCRFQRNVLDLSLQWRFANLPNNAKLEMVPVSRSREGPENTVG